MKLFEVKNPVKTAGHITYTVAGVDSEGPFEQQRRFREFFALKNTLVSRWPGIYIPALPEKKIVGNKDQNFIEERRILLERFMKDIAKFDYLTDSKEFKIFARERGDIEKMLASLLKQTPMQVLEKYRLNFNIEEDQEGAILTTYKENIMTFQNFAKKVIPTMEIQKKQMKIMMDTKTNIDLNYKTIINGLLKYEDNNVEYYSETDPSKRTLTHPSAGDVKERFEETYNKWKNPYKDAYLWIKGELLDVRGISEALLGREFVVKQQSMTETKKRSDQAELEKLS